MRVARLRKAYVGDRRRWLRRPLAVGRAVVCEGGLARSAWNGVKRSDPSRRDRMMVYEPLSTPSRN